MDPWDYFYPLGELQGSPEAGLRCIKATNNVTYSYTLAEAQANDFGEALIGSDIIEDSSDLPSGFSSKSQCLMDQHPGYPLTPSVNPRDYGVSSIYSHQVGSSFAEVENGALHGGDLHTHAKPGMGYPSDYPSFVGNQSTMTRAYESSMSNSIYTPPEAVFASNSSAGVFSPELLTTSPPVQENMMSTSGLVADSTGPMIPIPGIQGTNTFTCFTCDATFGRIADLQRHSRKHAEGPSPFVCPIGECERKGTNGFYRKDKLMVHLKKAHGWK